MWTWEGHGKSGEHLPGHEAGEWECVARHGGGGVERGFIYLLVNGVRKLSWGWPRGFAFLNVVSGEVEGGMES